MTIACDSGAVWNQPHGEYMRQAMEDLDLTDADLETPGNRHLSVTVGDYPNLDRVYARAWELQRADE